MCLLANANSTVVDYCARQKIGGISLSYFILKQLPVLPPSFYRPADVAYVASRVLELVYTAAAATGAREAEAAQRFIAFLRSPEAAAVIKAKGMTPF